MTDGPDLRAQSRRASWARRSRSARCSPRSSKSHARSSAPRRRRSSCSTRRRRSSCSRRSWGMARTRSWHALPGGHRDRRLGARDPDAARPRGRRERPALRARRRRGHGLRPEGTHGRTASARRGCARRPVGSRPAWTDAVHPPGDGASRTLRESGCDRRRPAAKAREAERLLDGGGELEVVARLATRGRRASKTSSAKPGCAARRARANAGGVTQRSRDQRKARARPGLSTLLAVSANGILPPRGSVPPSGSVPPRGSVPP